MAVPGISQRKTFDAVLAVDLVDFAKKLQAPSSTPLKERVLRLVDLGRSVADLSKQSKEIQAAGLTDLAETVAKTFLEAKGAIIQEVVSLAQKIAAEAQSPSFFSSRQTAVYKLETLKILATLLKESPYLNSQSNGQDSVPDPALASLDPALQKAYASLPEERSSQTMTARFTLGALAATLLAIAVINPGQIFRAPVLCAVGAGAALASLALFKRQQALEIA